MNARKRAVNGREVSMSGKGLLRPGGGCRVAWWLLLAGVLLGMGEPVSTWAAPRPNFLWITCEDISPLLGCYGDPLATTPRLDRLASEGVRYTNAFAAASVCSPARSCLITGVYPTSLGTQHLRSTLAIPAEVRGFSEYLRKAGYYCSNRVKEDYNFRTPPETWDESNRQAHWRKRSPGQPFFSVFNLTCTHQGQIRLPDELFAKRTARLTPDERHDPAEVALPPYYPDTPRVRRDLANLYDLVTAMDKQAGDLLDQLEGDGLAEDTIVLFFSDHGSGLPRHKRWVYDSGIRVPLLVRFPDKYRAWAPAPAGSTVDRLVSFVDFAPTMLSLAGLPVPAYMQGRVFLGNQAAAPREYVFAVRDRVDEVYEMSRAVRDKRFKYVRHYLPHRPIMQHSDYSERTPTRQEFRRLAAAGKLTGPPKQFMQPIKPAEELFDTRNDPFELSNLAGSPEHRATLERMRETHRSWVLGTRDTGFLPEAEMLFRAKGISPYTVARQEGTFPLERIFEAADLVGRGPAALPELTAGLSDSDSAVRYWSAVGLGVLAGDAAPATERLVESLEDRSPNVRLAAAEVLCRLDHEAVALPVIVEALAHDDGWVRLHAAIAIVALGKKAEPCVPEIQEALGQEHKHQATQYVRWALTHALQTLDASDR